MKFVSKYSNVYLSHSLQKQLVEFGDVFLAADGDGIAVLGAQQFDHRRRVDKALVGQQQLRKEHLQRLDELDRRPLLDRDRRSAARLGRQLQHGAAQRRHAKVRLQQRIEVAANAR